MTASLCALAQRITDPIDLKGERFGSTTGRRAEGQTPLDVPSYIPPELLQQKPSSRRRA